MNSKFKMITLTTTLTLLLTIAGQSFAATQPFSDLSQVDALRSLKLQITMH